MSTQSPEQTGRTWTGRDTLFVVGAVVALLLVILVLFQARPHGTPYNPPPDGQRIVLLGTCTFTQDEVATEDPADPDPQTGMPRYHLSTKDGEKWTLVLLTETMAMCLVGWQ